MTDDAETLLAEGVTRVVRVGDTVRRTPGPWTPRVHALLRHLEAVGFDGAPRVLGYDDRGREVLTYLAGDISNYPLTPAARSERALTSAARLLRRYHDATVDFVADFPDGWQLPARSPAEVVCHGDYAPYNLVLHDSEVVGIIDFDTAHPGSRAWDIAYAIYRFAPLSVSTDSFGTPAEQFARARTFCDAYGLDDRRTLPGLVAQRLDTLVAFMTERAAAGDAAYAGHIADGHADLYRRDAAHITANADALAAALA